MKWYWCLFFHRRYQKRTGERLIGLVTVTYYTKCSKCGCEQREVVYFYPQ